MAQKEGAETNQMKGKVMAETTTLRDRFAIAWMTGMHEKMVDIRKIKEDPKQAESDRRFVAKEAYAFADAMLAERQVGAIIDPDKEKEADEILHSNGLK